MRELGKRDLFFLLTVLLRRRDASRQWILDRCDEYQRDPNDHVDLWSRLHFKAVDVNEPVPTPNGFVSHGDLNPGDSVYGPDGTVARVIARTPIFQNADCYRVSFCDGYSVVVSGDHLWSVEAQDRSRINGTNERRKWKAITIDTRHLAAEVAKSSVTATRRFPRIPVAGAVYRPHRDLPLDPYVVGVWLGDGTAGLPIITCGAGDSEELSNHLMAAGVNVREKYYPSSRTAATLNIGSGVQYKRGSSDVSNALRELGILNSKRIPDLYMLGSIEQRFALLQGLMDTDGTCHKKHAQAIYCCANYALASDVFDLAQSLGLKATIAERSGLYKGERRAFWQVQFFGRDENPPFRMRRKADRCRRIGRVGSYRRIVAVDAVETRPVSCISVDRADGMYLVGRNYVPTHNSSVITFGHVIFLILNDPEITVGIFSHTRPMAKKFLVCIKRELESNELLKALYPEIFWSKPETEAPRWSEDGGIIVKRNGNPKESTVEAWGLVDGQPIGSHFSRLLYDDIVTQDTAYSDVIRAKVIENLQVSFALSAEHHTRAFVGTRYHAVDAYAHLIEKGIAKPRIHRIVDDAGQPVLLTMEQVERYRRDMGSATFASQMMLDPLSDAIARFKHEHIRHYDGQIAGKLNTYIVVDAANSKKKTSDFTAVWVISLAADRNYYVRWMTRDRLSLSQRVNLMFSLHAEWDPLAVGYERYGMMADVEAIRMEQERRGWRFEIIELGGNVPKPDRIGSLLPLAEAGRLYFPRTMYQSLECEGGSSVDSLARFFAEEWLQWSPQGFGSHDDGLDALARILDPKLGAAFPETGARAQQSQAHRRPVPTSSYGWMGA